MESKVFGLFVIISVFGFATSQNSNSLDFDDINKQLKDSGVPDMTDLEKKLQENNIVLPEGFNSTKLDLDKVEKALKEKCEKQGATEAVDSLKEQQESLKTCIMEKVNATEIQEELEEAKKTGSMDEVFAKYCNKWPEVYGCVENATVTVRSCMTEKEKKAFNKSLDIVQDLQEFMCFKDGDRLAMFVAEGGVECIQEQQEGIKDCVNGTVGGRFPDTNDLSVTSLPSFLFTEEDCQDFDKIRVCVNKELEKCKDSTPANIVDAFFKFLKKQMPCTPQEEKVGVKAAAVAATTSQEKSSVGSVANSVLVTVGMFGLLKFY